MTDYIFATDDERVKCAPELVGKKHVVVKGEKKLWVVKHKPGSKDEEKRDLLAYLLGHQFANVAEVKLLDSSEHSQIKNLSNKGENSLVTNTFIIRLGGSYSTHELPCKTLEQAVANELIYSLWIRRRDTHANNRAYTDKGIPVFFDHQTAFLGEPKSDINTFFSRSGEGHAGDRYPLN